MDMFVLLPPQALYLSTLRRAVAQGLCFQKTIHFRLLVLSALNLVRNDSRFRKWYEGLSELACVARCVGRQISRQEVSHSKICDMLVVQADCPGGMRRIDVGHVEVGQKGNGLKDGQISSGSEVPYSRYCRFHKRPGQRQACITVTGS